MSDIYLAISETPTVVTLTSAVINSAVASSVTVTNTVTVALDANSLSALENVTVTVGAAITGTVTVSNFPATQAVSLASVPTHAISGTVTANSLAFLYETSVGTGVPIMGYNEGGNQFTILGTSDVDLRALKVEPISLPAISGTVTVGNTVTIAGTVTANPTGTQTIAGSVTLGAGTSQIGSVTASISNFPTTQAVSLASVPTHAISGTVTANVDTNSLVDALSAFSTADAPLPISGTVTVGNTVTIAGTVTANPTGTQTIAGSVTASLAISSTAITSGSFASLTSATLVPGNVARKMATVYNLGAGQLFVNAGSSATTLGGGFMVALSSGDFYECDYTTTTLSAIFATAGTASWVSH